MTGSWGLLRPFWSLRGRSWQPLGGSWGAHEGVWEALGCLLGRLEGDPNATKLKCTKKVNFWTDFRPCGRFMGLHFGAQNRPKSGPKRVQNLEDFQERKSCASRASWTPLGPILGRFGRHLGLPKSAPVLEFVLREQNSRFCQR